MVHLPPSHVLRWSCLVASGTINWRREGQHIRMGHTFESRIAACISLARTPFILTCWRFRHFLLRLESQLPPQAPLTTLPVSSSPVCSRALPSGLAPHHVLFLILQ